MFQAPLKEWINLILIKTRNNEADIPQPKRKKKRVHSQDFKKTKECMKKPTSIPTKNWSKPHRKSYNSAANPPLPHHTSVQKNWTFDHNPLMTTQKSIIQPFRPPFHQNGYLIGGLSRVVGIIRSLNSSKFLSGDSKLSSLDRLAGVIGIVCGLNGSELLGWNSQLSGV